MGDHRTSSVDRIPSVIIYGKPDCKFCTAAKEAFTSVEIPFDYRLIEEALHLPGKDGKPLPIPEGWQHSGMVDLLAMHAMCGNPIPFIIVDGRGYKNLSTALDAIGYRERKRIILQRKRDGSA